MSFVKRVFIAVTFIFFIFVSYLYIDYRLIKVDAFKAKEFENRLKTSINANESIDLREITPFSWDKAFYFRAYTPPKEMYKKTGTKWSESFLSYLFLNDYEKEMLSDEFYSLVFMNKNKVVCHYTGVKYDMYFDIETQESINAENSIFRVIHKDNADILILVENALEIASVGQTIGQTEEISMITNSIMNYYGNTSDPVVIYEKIPFEGGTLVLAEKLSDGEHYPDLHFIDAYGKLTYLTRGSYCWTLNYTRFNGYNIFFGLAGVENRATPQNPVPNTKPVKIVEAIFSNETVRITPAENIIAHINPKNKDTRMFSDPKGYILPVKGWKMPEDFSVTVEGGEKISLSQTSIEYTKEYMPEYLKVKKADIFSSYAFTFNPMLTPAEWKQAYADGEVLLEGKTDARNNRNALFLRTAGNMLLTNSFIVPQDIRSFYLSNNSVRTATFSAGEAVKVIYPESRKLMDCRILKLTADNVQKEIGQDRLDVINTNEQKQLVLPKETGYYLFLLRTLKNNEIQTYTGMLRIEK